MLKIGLTGSIAVGKSYVARIFSTLGAFVVDADQTAREVVAPETRENGHGESIQLSQGHRREVRMAKSSAAALV